MGQNVFVWVVDTSVSMAQTTSSGLSLLQLAVAAVEHALKVRSRDPSSARDRHLLVTCGGVLCGWRDPSTRLVHELKRLSAGHRARRASPTPIPILPEARPRGCSI